MFLERLSGKISALVSDDIVTKLAGKGLNALVVKVASAGLSYIMFLLLARWMTPQEYGEFAMAFSFGSFLAFVALRGQHLMVLRYIPQYEGQENPALAAGMLDHSRRQLRMGTGWTVALTLALLAILDTQLGWAPGDRTLYMGAIFAAPFAYGMYQSHVLRAFGSINRALIPMDIVWRMLVPAGVFMAVTLGLPHSSGPVMLMASALLGGAVIWQRLGEHDIYPDNLRTVRTAGQAEHDGDDWRYTRFGLWGSSAVGAAAPQLATVIIGAGLSAEDAGIFFVAFKTAQLLAIVLYSINMITAPQLSTDWHSGNTITVRRTINLSQIVALSFSITVSLLVFIFPTVPLSFFGESYTNKTEILILLCICQIINSASGAIPQFLNISSRQEKFFYLTFLLEILLLISLSLTIYVFQKLIYTAFCFLIYFTFKSFAQIIWLNCIFSSPDTAT